MATAIESTGLTKRFGARAAVDGVDLAAPRGGVYGFLGRNGAGKTTTIRLILGLLRPSAGEVRVFGEPVGARRLKTAAMIGSLVETPALYDHLTGRENLDLTRRILALPKTEIDRVLEVVDLAGAAGRRVGGYSLGMRQRLGLARALLGGPRLLVLDEPTNGLDPDGIRDMRRLIRSLPEQGGVTVFVSSHLLAEVEQTADHVGLMHEGRLLAQTSLRELKGGPAELEIEVDEAERAAALLAQAGLSARREDAALRVRLPAEWTAAAVNRLLVGADLAVQRLAPRQRSLEDVYLDLTGARAPLNA
ncbi:ABC transporter ATP-binding protein [Caulobacter sp. 17J65-9]|uniref:ABC transporter ATP-binding protein n=1 Tax=Caulobacter sp. 17J65-9 TaxID=2709382 RepID=UPI0013CD218D|nr:ABC transporter ATP-binding protein [Caulobacter sp. 17J65-9]NEX92671.1 ABC transporter ATP-binding protein [Caulobacter sp. 17J65-9]